MFTCIIPSISDTEKSNDSPLTNHYRWCLHAVQFNYLIPHQRIQRRYKQNDGVSTETKGKSWNIKDLPKPVGKTTKTASFFRQ